MKSQRPYLLRALYEWIVDSDEVPYVLVDATIDDVLVPREHVQDGQIVLNIGPNAVRDLVIEEDHVMCGGRFGGRQFELFLPMASIRAIYAKDLQQGMVLPDDEFAAAEVAQGAEVAEVTQDDGPDKATPAADKPTLRLV